MALSRGPLPLSLWLALSIGPLLCYGAGNVAQSLVVVCCAQGQALTFFAEGTGRWADFRPERVLRCVSHGQTK